MKVSTRQRVYQVQVLLPDLSEVYLRIEADSVREAKQAARLKLGSRPIQRILNVLRIW